MAKTPQTKDETFRTGETQKKRVFAHPCPNNERHRTRVYKTGDPQRDRATGREFQRRYCICDDCGKTWYQDGPVANEVTE